MSTRHHQRTPEFEPNIPLLDSEFDAKSSDIDDLILSHVRSENEDYHMIGFSKSPDEGRSQKIKETANITGISHGSQAAIRLKIIKSVKINMSILWKNIFTFLQKPL
jgi:hypothetical protein